MLQGPQSERARSQHCTAKECHLQLKPASGVPAQCAVPIGGTKWALSSEFATDDKSLNLFLSLSLCSVPSHPRLFRTVLNVAKKKLHERLEK